MYDQSYRQSEIFDPEINIDKHNYYSVVNTEGLKDDEEDQRITFANPLGYSGLSNQTPDMDDYTTPQIYKEGIRSSRSSRPGKRSKRSMRESGDKGHLESSCCNDRACNVF